MSIASNKKFWLEEQKEKSGSRNALLTNKSRVTYTELYENSLSIASLLIKAGLKPGNNVGLLLNHSSDYPVALCALWFAKLVPVLINTRNNLNEIAAQLEFTETKIIITDQSNYYRINSLQSVKVILLSELKTDGAESDYNTEYNPDDIALILFTSGSTTIPKAVIHTFHNLYESVLLTNSFTKLSESDTWLASLPFYHIGGLMIIVRSLVTGATVAIPESVNYLQIKEALTKYNPSHISLVSTTLKQLLEEDVAPNKNLKIVFLGGGRLDKHQCENAIKKGFPIVKVYGSTETCSMISALSAEDFAKKPESVGKPLGGVVVKISNNRNEFLEPYKTGEIVVSSNSLMKGYFKNQEETTKKIKNGFYYTGDFGWLDKDGYLYIDLRREDLIVTGGENVNPKEVEQFIIQLPSIADAYVFAEQDDKWGQVVCAVVVASSNISEDTLKEQLRNMMAYYKVPKKIYFLENIPKNELGKVEKQKLLELLR